MNLAVVQEEIEAWSPEDQDQLASSASRSIRSTKATTPHETARAANAR